MEIALRPAYPTEYIDPLSVAPDPGVMGQMYIGAREKYHDGMTLACATPLAPYEDIKTEYARRYKEPGFSDVVFFDEHFEVTPPDEQSLTAKPGETLDEYTLRIRPKFIFPNTNQGNFDVWLPYDRSVAGAGRFAKHSFLWDGYQIIKGYIADNRWDLALNVIDNTEYEINRFGHPLNGSADFYVSRSQPDYFSHEVRALADAMGPEALVRYLPALEKDYTGYWMDGLDKLSALPLDGKAHTHRSLVRMPDGSFLNRYWDDASGPRLESYKEDVEVADIAVKGLIGAVRGARLHKVYKNLRAGAASGWDYSSRWFKDGSNLSTINIIDLVTPDLNSLLAHHEETLAMAYKAAANTGIHPREACLRRAAMYEQRLKDRVAAINKYLWDPKDKIYRDYNFTDGYQTEIVSAAMVYPLYVGIANVEQTFGVMEAVKRDLLYAGGIIATATENSKEQWDGGERVTKKKNDKKGDSKPTGRSKNVWAPPNWAAARGFARMAHILLAAEVDVDVEPLLKFAEEIKQNYMHGIETAFKHHHIVPEKHRGDNPEILANGGEYALVKVLAMPSETYRAMKQLDPRASADHLSMGRIAMDLAA